MKLSRDDKLRRKIAEKGKNKYMKYFNSNIVSNFIVNKTLGLKVIKQNICGKNTKVFKYRNNR